VPYRAQAARTREVAEGMGLRVGGVGEAEDGEQEPAEGEERETEEGEAAAEWASFS
jgi:hypothetical protein